MSEGVSSVADTFAQTGSVSILSTEPEETAEIQPLSFSVAAPPLVRREAAEDDPEATDRSTSEQRLKTFVGPNSETYLTYYHEVYGAGEKGLFRHWHWVPFALSVPWLFLRRRYLVALGSAALPIALGFALPGGLGVALAIAIIALSCGLAGQAFYIRQALNTIEQIEARRLWPVQRDEQIQDAGGVSLFGAIAGTILWAAAVVTPYFAGWMP